MDCLHCSFPRLNSPEIPFTNLTQVHFSGPSHDPLTALSSSKVWLTVVVRFAPPEGFLCVL